MPERWLEDGQKISISAAPTRFGRVAFSTVSHLAQGKVVAQLDLPAGFKAAAKIRLRVPGERELKSVLVNGAAWKDFTPDGTITVPPRFASRLSITANY